MKYIKKPIPIEAFKWTADQNQSEDPEWIVKALKDGTAALINKGTPDVKLVIKTLEGDHIANRGDYIIQGVHGEIYPCKPDIFEETYHQVNLEDEHKPKSILVAFAEDELELFGNSTDELQQKSNKRILQAVKAFTDQKSDSIYRDKLDIRLLKRILSFKPLVPLTGSPEEWDKAIDREDTVQNKRYGSLFRKPNGVSYDIEAVELNIGTGVWSLGDLRYRVSFPYMPRENPIILNLPKGYEDKTNEELIAYVKQHKNDSEEMADLAEHLFDDSNG